MDVRNFGAVGDGAHDDTAAIQAALASGSPAVLLPAGTYLVSAALTLPARTVLAGAGRQLTRILASPSGRWTSPAPSGWWYVLGAVNADDVTVRDLTVDAGGAVASCIAILGGDRPQILSCGARNNGGHSGVHFFGAQAPGVRPVRYGTMMGNLVVDCVYGLVWDGQEEDCVMVANHGLNDGTSATSTISHVSLDGTQGGTGIARGSVVGNVCQGRHDGTSAAQEAALNVYRAADVTVVGNTFVDTVAATGQLAHLYTATGAFSDNVFDNGAVRCGRGLWFSPNCEVVGANNCVRGATTGIYSDGANAGARVRLLNTSLADVRTPIDLGRFGAFYDFAGLQVDHEAYRPILPPAASPYVGGRVYRNAYGMPVTIHQPVQAATSGVPGSVTVASGAAPRPPVLFTRRVAGDATAAAPDVVSVEVAAGHLFAFTVDGAVLGKATIVGGR